MSELRISAHVLVAHVVAPDPTLDTIQHHDLAVIPEIELKPIAGAPRGLKRAGLDAGIAQLVHVRAWQLAAADLVVQKKDPYALARLADHAILEFAPEFVVGNDVELDQQVVLGTVDPSKDAFEGRLAVDQQLDGVSAEKRHLGEQLHRLDPAVFIRQLAPVRLDTFPNPTQRAPEVGVLIFASGYIAPELGAAEDPIRRHRQIRERVQGDDLPISAATDVTSPSICAVAMTMARVIE
jgi:hypothetical protein